MTGTTGKRTARSRRFCLAAAASPTPGRYGTTSKRLWSMIAANIAGLPELLRKPA